MCLGVGGWRVALAAVTEGKQVVVEHVQVGAVGGRSSAARMVVRLVAPCMARRSLAGIASSFFGGLEQRKRERERAGPALV